MRYPSLFKGIDLKSEVAEIKKYLRELVDEIRRAFNGESGSDGSDIPSETEIFKEREWVAGTEISADPSVIFGHTVFVAHVGSDAIPVQCLRSGSMIYGSSSLCTDTETPTFKYYAMQISCAADGVLTLLCSHYSDGETDIITAFNALK